MPMFCIIIAVLSLLVGAGNSQKLNQIIQDKCWKNSDNFFSALEISIASDRLQTCFPASLFENSTDILDKVDALCNIIANTAYRNVDSLAQHLFKCLEEDERFLSDLLLTSFNSTFEPLCGNDKLQIVDLIDTFVNGNCSTQFEIIGQKISWSCFKNLHFIKNLDLDNFTYKQDEACSDIRKIKECVEQSVKDECGTENVTLSDVIFKSSLDWCTTHELSSNTIEN